MLALPLCPCREAPNKTKQKRIRQEATMDMKGKREIQINIGGEKLPKDKYSYGKGGAAEGGVERKSTSDAPSALSTEALPVIGMKGLRQRGASAKNLQEEMCTCSTPSLWPGHLFPTGRSLGKELGKVV